MASLDKLAQEAVKIVKVSLKKGPYTKAVFLDSVRRMQNKFPEVKATTLHKVLQQAWKSVPKSAGAAVAAATSEKAAAKGSKAATEAQQAKSFREAVKKAPKAGRTAKMAAGVKSKFKPTVKTGVGAPGAFAGEVKGAPGAWGGKLVTERTTAGRTAKMMGGKAAKAAPTGMKALRRQAVNRAVRAARARAARGGNLQAVEAAARKVVTRTFKGVGGAKATKELPKLVKRAVKRVQTETPGLAARRATGAVAGAKGLGLKGATRGRRVALAMSGRKGMTAAKKLAARTAKATGKGGMGLLGKAGLGIMAYFALKELMNLTMLEPGQQEAQMEMMKAQGEGAPTAEDMAQEALLGDLTARVGAAQGTYSPEMMQAIQAEQQMKQRQLQIEKLRQSLAPGTIALGGALGSQPVLGVGGQGGQGGGGLLGGLF